MKISAMLFDKETKPMQIVQHPQFSRASWLLRSETYRVTDKDGKVRAYRHDTPLDSILRGSRSETANKLHALGM